MYNDNLIIDPNESIKIPQNDNSFFTFTSIFLKNSIEINIKPFEEIDTINLYIIIKSYTNNIKYPPRMILIAIKNDDFFIAHNVYISYFKKISYMGFLNWFNNQIENDSHYIRQNGIYKFIITYPSELMQMSNITDLKPNYPWKSEIINYLNITLENDNIKDRIIENQKKKIIELEEIIKKK